MLQYANSGTADVQALKLKLSEAEAELSALKSSPKRTKGGKDQPDPTKVTKEQIDQVRYEKIQADQIIAIKTKECDTLIQENTELKKKLTKRDATIGDLKKKLETYIAEYQGKISRIQFNATNALREKDVPHSAAIAAVKGSISAFHDPAHGNYVICPIPTKDGRIVSLSNII